MYIIIKIITKYNNLNFLKIKKLKIGWNVLYFILRIFLC